MGFQEAFPLSQLGNVLQAEIDNDFLDFRTGIAGTGVRWRGIVKVDDTGNAAME